MTSETNRTGEMNQEPERGTHDGLAAVAIALLTMALIALVVSKVI
jgi:hypothetical protein